MQTYRKSIALLAAGAALTLCSPAWLQAADTPAGTSGTSGTTGSFSQYDANNDGSLAKDEAKKAGIDESRFDKADSNRDGKLSSTEWQSMSASAGSAAGSAGATGGMGSSTAPGSSGATTFSQYDANNDGSLSKDEAKKAGIDDSRFDKADGNHDGKLSSSEWQTMSTGAGSAASGAAAGSTGSSSAAAPSGSASGTSGSAAPGTSRSAAGGQHSSNAILNMTPDQLKGKHIVNAAGKKIGEIDKVVKGSTGNQIFAVLSAGGFLGIGGEKVVVPITQLQMNGDRFTMAGISDENQLKQQQKYDRKNYAEIQGDQVLANVQKGGTGQQASAGGFDALDKNHDGYVDSDEAQASGRLSQNWQQYDKDKDGKLDQSEFSAFESEGSSGKSSLRDSDQARERPDRDSGR